MKRFTSLVALVCSLGVPLSAAEPPPPPALVAGFLELSGAQRNGFEQLLRTLQIDMAAVGVKLSARQQRLAELLSAEAPDPAAVGAAVLAVRAVEREGAGVLQTYRDGFMGILDSDQQDRAAFVVQVAPLLPVIGAFAALKLWSPPE